MVLSTLQDPAFSLNSGAVSFSSDEDLTRVFNTALVASQMPGGGRDFTAELNNLIRTPAFRAILQAVRTLSLQEGLSEAQSAEALVSTFRLLDQSWRDYILQEGIARLKG